MTYFYDHGLQNVLHLPSIMTYEHSMTALSSNDALPSKVTIDMLLRCERLGDPVLSHVWRWNENTVVKMISPASLAEAAMMTLVREKTSIPVPRILKSFVQPDDGFAIIFMEHIKGQPFDQAWDQCTASERGNIISQLKSYFHELRQVEPAPFIGSVDGSACNDQIFGNMEHKYGPYADEQAFRAGIFLSLRACEMRPTFTKVVIDMIEAMPRTRRIVLTHGDLVPRNILVRDGSVAGIVDWEMGGLLFRVLGICQSSFFFADYDHPWMEGRVLDRTLDPHRVELGVLLHTRKIFNY